MQRLDDTYYPVTSPRKVGHLERDHGHRIHWTDSGNEQGVALVLCHGGPGGSSSDGYRRFCDPQKYRVIQFDQRGCGKSEAQHDLVANTLQHSITDLEALRIYLEIPQWIVAGGSWGSTLALAYAEAYQERCLGLLLISTWLCREQDIQWWFHGVRTVFPELWEQFSETVPVSERHDLRQAYCSRILGKDKTVADHFATQLYMYEEGFMHFDSPLVPTNPERGPRYGRIFAHYASNNFFLEENQLLTEANKIAHLPAIMVTGRYDMCTTVSNTYDLSKALRNASVRVVPAAGHYPTESRLSVATTQAADDIWHMVQNGADK
jgi:proline iminopeptidase